MNDIYRLSTIGLGIASDTGILRAETLGQLNDAEALLRAAEDEAQQIRQRAQDVFEAEKKRGYDEGMAEADQAIAGRLMTEQGKIDEQLLAIEGDLAHLVHECVQRVIEHFSDFELSLEVTRSALSTMRDQRRGQLFVAPAMLDELRAAISGLLAEFPEIELIDTIADPALTGADLRLETDLGVINFSLDETLSRLRTLLEAAAR